jgi:peptidoglycan/xylan/chitin deacetylase (PgdA/CDA1 family)
VYREALAMKSLRTEEIERRLIERFGPRALQPRSDIDRPLTVNELRDFARHPLVHLGNHTANHAILTNYTVDEARAQILDAQRALVEMTGTSPCSIAYPNGGYNEQIEQICRENGLPIGFTIKPRKNPLPLDSASPRLSALSRFVPHAGSPIMSQCRTYRSDWLVYGVLRSQYVRLLRSGASN